MTRTGTMRGPQHSVSVSGIVADEQGRVLTIQRRDNGHWQAPGGVLELGETIEEGVRREVHEETGVNIAVDRLTGIYKHMAREVVALMFRCTLESGQPQATDEATAVQWLTRDQVDELMTSAFAVRVHDALNSRTATRAHDGTNILPA